MLYAVRHMAQVKNHISPSPYRKESMPPPSLRKHSQSLFPHPIPHTPFKLRRKFLNIGGKLLFSPPESADLPYIHAEWHCPLNRPSKVTTPSSIRSETYFNTRPMTILAFACSLSISLPECPPQSPCHRQRHRKSVLGHTVNQES